MPRNVTYHNPIHQEENTPLVAITATDVEKQQSTGTDSRKVNYVIDLAKAAFGGITYPEPGSMWYLKKISGVWTLMARGPRQNPQLDPSLDPQPGDTYIGHGGTTVIVGDVEINGSLIVGDGTDPDVGSIRLWPGSTAPANWLICDGSAISRATYALLFAIIGTTYGVGDGSTTFNIPDMRERVAVGYKSGSTEFGALNQSGGAKTVTLTTTNMPSHTHTASAITVGNNSADHTHGVSITSGTVSNDHSHNVGRDFDGGGGSSVFSVHSAGSSGAGGQSPTSGISANHTHAVVGNTGGVSAAHNHALSGSTGSAGSDGSHNNIQPYLVLNFVIKVLPVVGTGGGGGGGGGPTALDDLTDVIITSPTTNQVLKYNGSVWVNAAAPGGSLALDDLTDVVVSSSQDRQLIQYNGTSWSNRSDVVLAESTAGTAAISMKVGGDSQERLIVGADGKHNWGSGSATQDTNLYRSAAGILATDGSVLLTDGTKQVNVGSSGSAAAFAAKVAATTTDVLTSRVTTDTNSRYVINGDGKLEWGSGAATQDANLYRGTVGRLATDGSIDLAEAQQVNIGASGSTAPLAVLRSLAASGVLSARVTGDVASRLAILASGTIQWGDGTSSADTNLYRNGVNILKTDGSIQMSAGQTIDVGASGSSASYTVKRGASTDGVFSSRVTGDVDNRFLITADGKQQWGDGTAAVDTNLYRLTTDTLQTDDAFRSNRTATGDGALATKISTDTSNRLLITADGKHSWGAGGVASVDTNLYRSAADTLKTDDAFIVVGAFSVGSGPVEIDPSSPTTTHVLRYNGTKFVSAALSESDIGSLVTDLAGKQPMATLTTKGDLYVATASATVARQGVGADGTVLYADSGQTNGMRWKALAESDITNLTTDLAGKQPLATLTTKGDLYVATGAGVVVRLPVGSDTHVLTADSAQTAGIKWAPGSGGGGGGTTLAALTDVALTSLADRNVFQYDAGSSLWKNRKDLILEQASAAADAISSRVASDANERFIMDADGTHHWGDGTSTQDTNLYRAAAGTLQTDGAIRTIGGSAGAGAYATQVTGDSQNRFLVTADGGLSWGTGALSRDTNLYRSAADSLKTDDFFIAQGGLSARGTEIDPSSSTTADVLRYDGSKYVHDASVAMIGEIKLWPTITAPSNWQLCDGTSLLRATYATLSALLQPTIGTMTITIASPAVVSFTSHGLSIGDKVFFTTTGALPTGVSSDTTYWVLSSGFGANSFQIATTQGGTAINTTGSQSGTHTLLRTYFGVADSTHFNVPDFRGKNPTGRDSSQTEFAAIGMTGGAKTHTMTTGELVGHTHGSSALAIANESAHTHSISITTGTVSSDHSHTIGADKDTASGSFGFSVHRGAGSGGFQSNASSGISANHTHLTSGTSAAGSAHNHTISGSTDSTGSATAFSTLDPYMPINYIIRLL